MSIRHALLALLSEQPRYGLQLRQEFEARTGAVWPLNVGQVYTTLQRLERDGLVEPDGGPHHTFAITAEGERELGQWLRTPPATAPPPRDELLIKVLVAARLPGVDVHEVVQTHRRRLIETMQEYTNVKADAAADDVELALVVDAEVFRIEGVLRWLDAADTRLAALSRTGADNRTGATSGTGAASEASATAGTRAASGAGAASRAGAAGAEGTDVAEGGVPGQSTGSPHGIHRLGVRR